MKNKLVIGICIIIGFMYFSCDNGNNSTSSTPKLSSINVSVLPTIMFYTINEEFNPTGMIVIAIYSDDSQRTLLSTEYTLDIPSFDTAGEKVINVSFGDFNDNFTVTVDFPKLQAPVISLLGDLLSWAVIEGASSYTVRVVNADEGNYVWGTTYMSPTATNIIIPAAGFNPGNYAVSVIANGVSGVSSSSIASNIIIFTVGDYPRLPAPVLKSVGTNLLWEKIDGAGGYQIQIGPVNWGYSCGSSEINYDFYFIPPGDYTATIIARGTFGVSKDSEPSNIVSFTVPSP